MKRSIALVLALAAQTATAQEAKRPEVLILGVYHMASPGRDVFNSKVDDVLAPKRQQEIAELARVLEKFKPTKVAVEWQGQSRLDDRFKKYVAGQYVLTANEVDQIGLRVAKDLGLETVYAVDIDGEFPWLGLVNYAKANGQGTQLDSLLAEIGTMVKNQNEFLSQHSVLETLRYMNADSKVTEDVGYYYREARYGENGDYAGPDLLAEWFKRNVRIYNNIMKLQKSPDERILVIYGSGHLGWLRNMVASNPALRLRKLEEFVGR
ncbi:MAG TPA: DUF5694 domain-containing protein [Gemmatimonadaceae bacterium]|nr:DUF5694 domain-containing protein [Gemmatimonadaceae bacterium]